MQWSKYQLAFFEAVERSSDSLRVEAVAGSGKTTSSVEALNRAHAPRILALAFNKKIALELERRLPKSVTCKTMNSIGHTAFGRMLPRRPTLDQDKLFNILSQDLKPEGELAEILALTRAARVNGLVPKEISAPHISLLEDTKEAWEDLALYYDIEFSDQIYSFSRQLLIESISAARRGLIDFDDQIYMSALFGAPFQTFDLVLVDEAQDLSLVQHRMLRRCLARNGRLIAVGDSHQAIYGFRGASAKSLDLLSQQFNLRHLPLSISYRCPKAVVRAAQAFVPHIEPSDSAPEGEVLRWNKWRLSDLPSPCAIVCRNNAPLLEFAFKAIKEGKGVTMLGRDIGKGLVKLISTIAPASIPIEQFFVRLHTWADKEIARKPKKEGVVRDKLESLLALGQGASTSAELIALAERIFAPSSSPITLASIHRAKGLEWENVVFLDSWRIPSKYATQEWEKEQERNCAYIAITRAQRRLIYADILGLQEA